MEKTIWKYEIETVGTNTIPIPLGYQILTVQVQDGKMIMWVEVIPEAKTKPVTIQVYGTGWKMPEVAQKYIATVQMNNGLVWHVYEIKS